MLRFCYYFVRLEFDLSVRMAAVLIARRGSAVVVTLNRPKALNALNHEMVSIVRDYVGDWNPDISCFIFKGTGDKAFCAGDEKV